MKDIDVLVVGAGPTGLVLALYLAHQGVKPRIIAKAPGPGESSRAMAVHARTLEFYRQLGFAEEVIERGIRMKRIHLREGDDEVALFRFGDFGEGLSPYPFALSFPQDDHERLLVEKLSAAGVDVEWNTELVDLVDDGERVSAMLRKDGVDENVAAAYLCGCDGARSAVRHALGIEFAGGTYDQNFYVADVAAKGEAVDNDDINACLSANGFVLVFPIRSSGMQRLIGIVPEELEERETLTFEDIRPFVERMIDVNVEKVNWFSRYKSHHRVADHFRVGRVFIAGDAGHIHSPMGGQGMNTGIGDAMNLAWKLAAVVEGRGDASLLDTYEPERIAFAHTLVATTDKAFRVVAGKGATSQVFRELIAPHLAPFALGFSRVRRAMFRAVSQTRINYRGSALSVGTAGEVQGGDRLPWAGGSGIDNFAPLASLDWQVHVYGDTHELLKEGVRDLGLALHQFPWSSDADEAGIERDALYLVRPDGYVALASPGQDLDALRAYVSKLKILPRR
jgi:2-polyprenyl-6-methoxyphenol hydroxylase-like FAD-dependent oxidoreductase